MIAILSDLETLLGRLLTEKRRFHVFSVVEFARKIGEAYGVDMERLEMASLAHDLFRDVSPRRLLRMARAYGLKVSEIERYHPVLLHGKVAAEYLRRRYRVEDEEVLMAVAYHTSGHVSFGEIGKILFVADSIEPTRNFPGVESLRRIVFQSLEEGFSQVLKNKIFYAVGRDLLLLPETVELWNSVLTKKGGRVDEELE